MKRSNTLSLSVLLAYVAATSAGTADMTPIQNGSYVAIADGTSTDFTPGFSSAIGTETPIIGFKKFDSSLGTLTQVILTFDSKISGDGTLSYYFESTATDPVDDENFGDDFTISYSGSIQTDIVYNSSSVVNDDFNADVFEEGIVDESGYYTPDSTLVYEYFGTSQSLSDGPNTSNGSISTFDMADFVGSPTEDVTALAARFFTQIDDSSLSTTSGYFGELDSSNIFLETTVILDAGTATLQYEYIPASGATPKVTSYSKVGDQHTIDFSGPAGQTDWALKGSTNLLSFPTDHSSSAIFTEPSPGNYQVVATLPGLPADAYFFVVE